LGFQVLLQDCHRQNADFKFDQTTIQIIMFPIVSIQHQI